VHLSLGVNGRRVVDYVPEGPLLGPGNVGLLGFAFEDVTGPTIEVEFDEFDVSG
jgi:hypothetical protein